MSEYESGNKSAAVLRVKIETNDRYFNFPEKTNTDAVKSYIIEEALKYDLTVDPQEIYYIGNRMIGNTERYNTIEDIDNYLVFITSKKKK